MSSLIRSPWLRCILPAAIVLLALAAGCGDDSEVIVQELNCNVEGFEGGTYLFTINKVSDSPTNCTLGLGSNLIGEPFGPVDLPGTAELPAQRDIPGVPLVGTVPVNITTDGKTIRIQGTAPIEANYPGIGNITATVQGVLCPLSATRVDGQITVKMTRPIACSVAAQASGSLQ